MGERQRILSITHHDCEMQTFRCGGKGGQNVNKRDTGVRFIHHPSGARGESREERAQLQNKKIAFRRMAESVKMKIWIMQFCGQVDAVECAGISIDPKELKFEVRKGGQWVEVRDVE